MIHDPELLDKLAGFRTEPFEGKVFRCTRMTLDPTAYSTWGGRWAPKGDIPVLYTSMEPDGAVAELSFHLSQVTPAPSKPIMLHTLNVSATQTLRLIRADLSALGVDMSRFGEIGYPRTQDIGSAVAFLENDGLIVPSARWECENLILFDDGSLTTKLDPVGIAQSVDWQAWNQRNSHGKPKSPPDSD